MSSEFDLMSTKLEYLNETKNIIKEAIIEKGQAITDEDTFRDYAQRILDIETGTGMDTSDATAAANDILEGKTAYIAEGKVEGTIAKSYKLPASVSRYTYSSLTKSLSYNFGVSDDFKYLVDYRTVSGTNTIVMYKVDDTDKSVLTQIATSTSNLPGTAQPDIQFSPIIENGIYRFALAAGRYTSIYDFNSITNEITFILKTDLTSYTSNTIYCINWTNKNKNVFAVTHTNLGSWGYGPVTTCFKLIQDSTTGAYQYSTLWNTATSRWQAGHPVFFAQDDRALCYNNIHNDQTGAGYYLINSDYSLGTRYNSWTQQCAVDMTNGHRIVDKNIQILSNGSWTTTGTIPNTPSDPDFVVICAEKDLILTGQSWSGGDTLRIYQVGWEGGTTTLMYSVSIPLEHQYFGSNNGSQVIGNIRFSANRFLFHNRKTTPVIGQIVLTDELEWLVRDGVKYRDPAEITGSKATPTQVLSGYKFYNADMSLATGTMTNVGSATITPTAEKLTRTPGYYSSLTINSVDSSSDYSSCLSLTNNILSGVEKVIPTDIVDSGDATATSIDINFGKTAYVNGKKVTGIMKTNNIETYMRDILHFSYVPDVIKEYIATYYPDSIYCVYYLDTSGYELFVLDKNNYADLKFDLGGVIPNADFENVTLHMNMGHIDARRIVFGRENFELLEEGDVSLDLENLVLLRYNDTIPFETNIPIYNDSTLSKRILPCEIKVIDNITVTNISETQEYGYELGSDGWYYNTNNIPMLSTDASQDWALARISFDKELSDVSIIIEYQFYATGSNEDTYGRQYIRQYFSKIDTPLQDSVGESSANYYDYKQAYSQGSESIRNIEYKSISTGNHFIDVKLVRSNYLMDDTDPVNGISRFRIVELLY